MSLFPMVHHCRMAYTFHSLDHQCYVYSHTPMFVRHSMLLKSFCLCVKFTDFVLVFFGWILGYFHILIYTCAVNTTISVSITFASGTNSNISYRIKVWFQHLWISENFITKRIQTIQWNTNIGCCYPVLWNCELHTRKMIASWRFSCDFFLFKQKQHKIMFGFTKNVSPIQIW